MKTLKFICMGLLGLMMSACSNGNLTPAEVAAKIDSHEPLTESDYSVMIDYCGDYAKSAQRYYDVINAAPSDSSAEYSDAASDLASLRASSPYIDMFRTAIYAASDDQIGARNVKKVNEYEKYEAFPLPDGSGKSLNIPGEVGVIEDMPDTDTSGVIADPDGIVVDKK